MRYFQHLCLAHFQNGELSDEFADNLDICLAKHTNAEDKSPVLLAISENNVYDGYVGKGYPTDLKRTFLAIRKKDSEDVSPTQNYNSPLQIQIN